MPIHTYEALIHSIIEFDTEAPGDASRAHSAALRKHPPAPARQSGLTAAG